MKRVTWIVLAGLLMSGLAGACGGGSNPSSSSGGSGGSGGGENACKLGGTACEAFSECCSGTCDNQVCTVCHFDGEACGEGCCLGLVCANGTCAPACSPEGASCTLASECCSNVCHQGLCEGNCRAAGESCTGNNQCCDGNCANGVCVAPCRADGAGCVADGECCGGACTQGLCCKPQGGACTGDGECCAGFCYMGACTQTCPDVTTCADWGNRVLPYGDLCGDAQQAADAVIACACAQCADACGGASCTTNIQQFKGGPDPQGCTACLNDLFGANCKAQVDACFYP